MHKKHTQVGEEEEGVVRQQADGRCFRTFQPACTAAAAVQCLELCLCVKTAAVRACPAAWAPWEGIKVQQGALKFTQVKRLKKEGKMTLRRLGMSGKITKGPVCVRVCVQIRL